VDRWDRGRCDPSVALFAVRTEGAPERIGLNSILSGALTARHDLWLASLPARRRKDYFEAFAEGMAAPVRSGLSWP
jgi:hypothetical protein